MTASKFCKMSLNGEAWEGIQIAKLYLFLGKTCMLWAFALLRGGNESVKLQNIYIPTQNKKTKTFQYGSNIKKD